jgi:hypothetical protein
MLYAVVWQGYLLGVYTDRYEAELLAADHPQARIQEVDVPTYILTPETEEEAE